MSPYPYKPLDKYELYEIEKKIKIEKAQNKIKTEKEEKKRRQELIWSRQIENDNLDEEVARSLETYLMSYKGEDAKNKLFRDNLREIKKLEKRWKILAWVIAGISGLALLFIIPRLSGKCATELGLITIFGIFGIFSILGIILIYWIIYKIGDYFGWWKPSNH